jgi:hypothetical protein
MPIIIRLIAAEFSAKNGASSTDAPRNGAAQILMTVSAKFGASRCSAAVPIATPIPARRTAPIPNQYHLREAREHNVRLQNDTKIYEKQLVGPRWRSHT